MGDGSKGSSVALGETLRLAMDTMRAHKLRTSLTLLGIILAVTTLVAVISVVNGLNQYVADRVALLGSSDFVVDRFGIITNAKELATAQRRPLLTVEDYRELKEEMQLADRVGAMEGTTSDIRSGNELFPDAEITGVTAEYADIRSISVAAGRFFNDADDLHREPVCFLGAELADKFFPGENPVGQFVRAGSHTYQVIGTAAVIGSVFGVDQDNFMLVPFSTYESDWHVPNGSVSLAVEARNMDMVDAAMDEARLLLRARHHLPYSAPDDFGIMGSASVLSLWQTMTDNVFALAMWLTAVFLAVGGIVIMNIMLASVTERTREIGIRKALGARRRHILMQFLVESAMLSSIGGIAGVGLALAIASVVQATTALPIATSPGAIATALALSTAVGLFFGIYPAMRAARLDPIVALRAET